MSVSGGGLLSNVGAALGPAVVALLERADPVERAAVRTVGGRVAARRVAEGQEAGEPGVEVALRGESEPTSPSPTWRTHAPAKQSACCSSAIVGPGEPGLVLDRVAPLVRERHARW